MTSNIWNTPPGKPLIIAHRGGALLAAENSIAAFEAATIAGADAVETDVRQTSDGELVCFHDETLKRICDDPRAVAEIDFATLRQLLPSIMTLKQALLVSKPLGVLLDVKLPDSSALEAVLSELSSTDVETRIILGLRSLDLIRTARRMDERVQILSLLQDPDAVEKAKDAGANWFRLWQGDLTENHVESVRRSGMRLAVMVGQPRNVPLEQYPPHAVGHVDAEGLGRIAASFPDAIMLDDPRLMPLSRG
ncbi:cobalamin biosynthesis protein [Sinorhizobium meliloti]|uniref:glycerophosphodiester phosphodiesterase n=1 Tax=Rhizobium meliloti TaxID=382 RepID=UPI000FD7DC98|nr:glycerophosphodiester phosphodiesterase family protein [Sinorhizobium meliloti]RVK52862.1 cobalamin biosynthesis protein [Sinorhizobium meliloti]